MSLCPQCGHEARFHDLDVTEGPPGGRVLVAGACRVGNESGVPCGCTAPQEDDRAVLVDQVDENEQRDEDELDDDEGDSEAPPVVEDDAGAGDEPPDTKPPPA